MGKEIVVDGKSVKAAFHKDCMALILFVIGMWCVILFVLQSVLGLTDDPLTQGLLLAAAIIGGISLSLAIFAVFLHIRKNRDQIYKEDLENQIRTQK